MIVKETWDSVTGERLVRLIRTILARCRAIFGAGGGYAQTKARSLILVCLFVCIFRAILSLRLS